MILEQPAHVLKSDAREERKVLGFCFARAAYEADRVITRIAHGD